LLFREKQNDLTVFLFFPA